MKKKLLLVLVVILLLFPATIFAGDLFGLSIGASAILLEEIPLDGDIDFDPADVGMDDFELGGEIRFNISLLELSVLILPVDYGEYEDGYYLYATVVPMLGLSVELVDLVDLGVAVGTWGDVFVSTEGDFDTSYYDIKQQELFLRASVDFNLGFLSVGGFAMVFPQMTVGEVLDSDFEPSAIEVPTSAYVGVSALINLL